jgi:hypothetical protein
LCLRVGGPRLAAKFADDLPQRRQRQQPQIDGERAFGQTRLRKPIFIGRFAGGALQRALLKVMFVKIAAITSNFV